MVPFGRANTTRPHCSIPSYIRSTCVPRGFTCVPIIGTHTYQQYQDCHLDTIGSSWTNYRHEPLPSRSSWFSRVHQVGPCRRPENGHYPLSNGVRNPAHIWALPTLCNRDSLEFGCLSPLRRCGLQRKIQTLPYNPFRN